MANEFPHKHIIGYVHIAPNIEIDKNISATDHSTYCASSIFGIYAKNGRQAIDVCAETGTTYINGVDPVAAYAYTYTAIPVLENIINGKLNNYIKDHDVFHFGGTFTAGTEQGNFGTFSYLKNDSMVIVGTTVKVQNDGWFGNYNVHAGDLLIAYSDSASRNSTTYWDVIETHLGPLNSKGTYTQGNKPNFLTNIYLNDNGDLSYSYSYFTQVHSYVNGGTASDLDSLDNTTNVITTVVSNINFDASGKLSYQLHNLTNAKSHHSQQKNETVEQSVITNLSLSSRGHLTYTASVLSETSSTSGNITVGDANNESFTLIDGIKQSGNGSVSYHYKTITVSYKHHTNEGTATTNLTFGNGGTDSTQIITNVNLSDTGKLTYDYLTLKESQSHHGGSVSANTYNFVDKVELSATGTLSGSTKNTVANSNKIYVTPKNTKGSYYIPFFDGSGTEYKTTYVDSNLYYDPSTNTAYISRIHSDISGDINGDVTGDVTGNTYGNTYGTVFGDTINAFLTTIKQDTDHNSTYYIALVNKTSGSSYTYVDSNDLYFNPNTNILTTGNLNVIGNTTLGDAATDKVTVNGTTNFKQAVDIDSTLNVYRETTLGHLTSTGNTTLTNLHIDGLLDVKTGSSQYAGVESAGIGIHCNVGISGTVGIEGDLIITGNTTFNDGITVNGTANFKDAVDIDKTLTIHDTTVLKRDNNTTDTMFYARREDLNKGIGFGIGTSNNRGIYDETNGWILKVTTKDNVIFSGASRYLQTQEQNTVDFYEDKYKAFIKWKDSNTAQFIFTDDANGNYKFYADTAGNASTADKLKTSRNIFLTEAVEGNGIFDGSSDVIITTHLPYKTATVNAEGWYRIATTAKNIGRASRIFQIEATLSSYHTVCTLTANTNYNTLSSNGIQVLSCSHFVSGGITKARLVYDSEGAYSNKYVYLEVYVQKPNTVLTIRSLEGFGWMLSDIATGSIPTGYVSKEVSLQNNTMVTGSINITGNLSSSATIKSDAATNMYIDIGGNTPLVIKYDNTEKFVAPGSSFSNLVNLGTSARKWANVYATTFNGALSGNASTADKLKTARNIKLTGSVTGNANFDGSGNIEISTSTNHAHNFTPAGTVSVTLAHTETASKAASDNTTSVATGAHTHATVANGKHTPSGTVTSEFAGNEVAAHTHTTSGTAASAGAHTHTTSGTAASAGAHTHTISGTSSSNGAHRHTISGTSSSNGAHRHTISGTSSSNGAHTHTTNGSLSGSETSGILTISFVSGTTSSNGAHAHIYSATTSSNGAHTHSYSATTSSAGAHTHSYSATTSSAGAHTHTTSGTAASAGAHTHTTSGSAAAAGKHTPSGTITSIFAGDEVASHTHTINATGTGSRVSLPNTSHTHNYDKASVQSASFSGNQGTTN